MRRTLDPKLDVVFKLLFADERNRPLLISLLTAVLKPSSPFIPKLKNGPVVADAGVLRWAQFLTANDDEALEQLAIG